MMTTTQTNTKASLKGTTAMNDKPVTVVMNETPAQKRSLSKLDILITKACEMSISADHMIAEAAMACVKHFEEFQDARPLDRLVKGVAETHRQPLIFWIKQNSPIHWNPQGEVKVYKPEDKNFKPLNVEALEATPYHSTKEVQARNRQTIEPMTTKMFFDRIGNFKRQLQNVTKEDSKREFDASYGDTSFAEEFLDELELFIQPWQEKADKKHKAWLKAQKAAQEAARTIRAGGKNKLIAKTKVPAKKKQDASSEQPQELRTGTHH